MNQNNEQTRIVQETPFDQISFNFENPFQRYLLEFDPDCDEKQTALKLVCAKLNLNIEYEPIDHLISLVDQFVISSFKITNIKNELHEIVAFELVDEEHKRDRLNRQLALHIEIIDDCYTMFVELVKNKYPVSDCILQRTSDAFWTAAKEFLLSGKTESLLLETTLETSQITPDNFFDLVEQCKTYDMACEYIEEYMPIHTQFINSLVYVSQVFESSKLTPFYHAICRGLPDFILEAFIDCNWNLDERWIGTYEAHSALHMAHRRNRFNIVRQMIDKGVELEGYRMNDQDHNLSTMRSYDFNFVYYSKDHLEKFNNFEDRLEFAKYISYTIEAGFQPPSKVYNELLGWYEKYRFDLFTKCAKKDPFNLLHMLNKDIFAYIKNFL